MPYLSPPEDLEELLPGEPSFRADQVRHWLYETPVLELDEMTNLPVTIREYLAPLWPFTVEEQQEADGGRTVKWLFRAPDGAAIEAVLMGDRSRVTLCISSQAGCAMGCTFCATGQCGFDRHLSAGEIIAQVAYAKAYLRAHPMPGSPERLGNVVFMGMGEPLANYDQVRESIRRMVEIMGMSARSITVSTVGFLPGMLKLAEEPWPVTLALSLHAAHDDLRERLVPLNRRYPIDDLIEAAAAFQRNKGRRVTLEWTLMEGVNDTAEQATVLASIAAELRAHVNVIALNPTPLSKDRPPTRQRAEEFVALLAARGANVTLRDTRGQGIDAACGQLRARKRPPS
ncbi:MAG: 23S rRNA (adenine(2503)-C(2))-methyltransferase RlmN [Acidimicrobiia bacterium]|nr:23S rRNA (adenine(2503)-C(2))-methyltransferase RlmN [Acidimicrobiia bacterium]